ncbi:hypothetical protein [Planctomyces sp. SH-PL62]|uniref:hypothetical protein n=1 Tax=Planctomyces sp. SH-PL62 TaxID=1636152 RepID=UPI00078B63DD|nr:hypothetical protein [Planctomyces sp. SH-PL62]AMV38490.1 hypothetical protein VT85_13725 [Planctomyces sp. SH-PL62]
MPPRLVSVAILVYWSIAAFFLLKWEVLPELSLGYPPDLRSIVSAAGDDAGPASWSIDVLDDPRNPEARRNVGEARTETKRLPSGGYEMTSTVEFDAGELLKRTPLANSPSVRLTIDGDYRVDSRGDLKWFIMKVRGADEGADLFKVEGKVSGGVMDVRARGIASVFNLHKTYPYESRSVVYDALRPLDRLPGLNVGQRWDVQVVNPLSGMVETARVEVKRRTLIVWNGEAVSAFEVEQHAGPITTKTWVRLDGAILRQQVPLPFVEMILERLPDKSTKTAAEADRKGEQ